MTNPTRQLLVPLGAYTDGTNIDTMSHFSVEPLIFVALIFCHLRKNPNGKDPNDESKEEPGDDDDAVKAAAHKAKLDALFNLKCTLPAEEGDGNKKAIEAVTKQIQDLKKGPKKHGHNKCKGP